MLVKVIAAVCLIAVASAQLWQDLTHINECAHEATHDLCMDCCHSAHWTIAVEERLCDRRCEHLAPVGKRQSGGDIIEIAMCHQHIVHADCTQCCEDYAAWEIPQDKTACVHFCDSLHFGFIGKRQTSTDITEILTCHEHSVHAECRQCCDDYPAWENPADHAACLHICDNMHFLLGFVGKR